MNPCRGGCGTMLEPPATVCSTECYELVFNETRAELYDDNRHEHDPSDDDETETEETEED